MSRRAVTLAVAGVVVVGLVAVGANAWWPDGESPSDPQAFCEQVRAFRDAVGELGRGPESADQVEAARDAAVRVADTARALSRTAPVEIEADVAAMVATSASVAERLRDFYDGVLDDPDRAQDAGYLSSFDVGENEHAEAERAARRVRPWITQHCGIELEPLPEG